MKKNYFTKVVFALVLSLLGFANANAQFLENTETVDVVQISTWMKSDKSDNKQYYVAANSSSEVVYEENATEESTRWYQIPAGGNAFGQQVYYYKNVATGEYLQGSSRDLATEGDWIVSAATTSAENDKSNLYKWSRVASRWGNGPWLVNEMGNTGEVPLGDDNGNSNGKAFFALIMNVLDSDNGEFFGVEFPNVAISNPGADGGNAWTAVTMTTVQSGVANPDIPRFLKNTETVAVVQISTWMGLKETVLDGAKPYVASVDGEVIYLTDATNEATKWYEIPAGGNAFGEQVYYYKNVATGEYLQGSSRQLSEEGDWIVSAATSSATNNYSNLFKWSKMTSNWGNGPWLVNEEGNTGTIPADGNTKAFFALTSLNLDNGEFFGVSVPSVAISNPHSGGNAWTAVEIIIAEAEATNPDFLPDNAATVDVVQISTWMGLKETVLDGAKPYVASADGEVIYLTDATNEATKWYEIPAGANAFGQQAYYYKNVATGEYLQGSSRQLSEEGDWIVSAATSSATNNYSNLFKWSKMASNWGNGPWLVNEEGNTGTIPADGNTKAFFALTSLNLNNGEFFGVSVPSVAISNPHSGGNAWTAVEIKVAEAGVTNPDYVTDGNFIFPLDNVTAISNGELVTYDNDTHVFTTTGEWQYVGWKYDDTALDLSEYNTITIQFEADAELAAKASIIEVEARYADGSAKTMIAGKSNEKSISITLNKDAKSGVSLVFLKSQNAGSITLKKAYASYIEPQFTSDLVVTAITWVPGEDVTWDSENPKYKDEVFFVATVKNIGEGATPKNKKHGVAFSVSSDAGATWKVESWSDYYNGPDMYLEPGEEIELKACGGNLATNPGAWSAGRFPTYKIKAEVNDTKDFPEDTYDNNILEVELTIDGKADLIVTDITWEPAEPQIGDEVTFSAVIKNQGTVNTPRDTKKGVAFSVNDVIVSWSDDNYDFLVAGNTVTLEANSGPSTVATWTVPASGGEFTIKGEVNDGKVINESDYTNNTFTKTLSVTPNSLKDALTENGYIYVRNNTLNIVGYPSAASVHVYNVLGHTTASYNAISNDMNISVPNGIYIVEIQYEGSKVAHKVVVK